MIQAILTLLAITGLYYWTLSLQAETTGVSSKEYINFKKFMGACLMLVWVGFSILALI